MNKESPSIVLIMSVVGLISTQQIFAQNWPGWRSDGLGISPEKNLPLKWSENEGVVWKTPIPGPISCRHPGIRVPLVRAQHDETVSNYC